jgi:serine/threonine-protein kinase
VDIEILEGLQAALGDRYRIEREIGRGGMATVYLAEDAKHKRMVALKILHSELAAAVGPKRFRREIAIVAQLQHPHILPLLDSGEEPGGPLWFAMPYVEGESLRERLEREHQLPLGDALRITREIAGALEYAHQRRVIHRDVKPENILLSPDGRAMLADFGVARDLINSLGADGERRLTDSGLSVGTLEYMSPEQSSGRPDIDARSDIYSLGCVLYEMIAGEPPFTGATPQALVARRLVERPLPLRSVRDRIPESLEQAVDIALARVPADRFASAREFETALDEVQVSLAGPDRGMGRQGVGGGTAPSGPRVPPHRRTRPIAAYLAAGIVAVIGIFFLWNRWTARSAGSEPVRLAVMPFDGGADSISGIFADGITDAVRGKLGALPGVQVIARGSSLPYRRTTKSPEAIARELGVSYLLTGEVRADSGPNSAAPRRVHVRPKLTRIRDGSRPAVVWQAPLDSDLGDVFQVESRMATGVAAALGVPMSVDLEQQMAEQPTHNLEAYSAFLQAEARRSGVNPTVLHQRAMYYTRAVTLDSTFGSAWAGLSIVHSALFYGSTPTVAEATAAADALSRAQELIPGHPETQIALATYEIGVHKDPARARAAAEAGLATAPNSVDLLYSAASAERSAGQWSLALQHVQQAERLDPRSVRAQEALGTTLLYLRRYREARAAYGRALALDPQGLGLYEFLVLTDLGMADTTAAHEAVHRALAEIKDSAQVVAFFASANDLWWVLSDTLQHQMLKLGPAAFDGDRAAWGMVRAETYWTKGDTALAKMWADTARREFAKELRESPQDDLLRLEYGLAFAYLGRKPEAIQNGEQGAAMMPVRIDAVSGLYDQQVLARIYILVGETDKAVDHLDTLLQVPSFISPARLRIEPIWVPLRGNPHFERLTAESGKEKS